MAIDLMENATGALDMTNPEQAAFEFFVRTLANPNSIGKRTACEGLALLGDLRAIEPLMGLFEFEASLLHPEDAEAAMGALVALGTPCVPRLSDGLLDEDSGVREYAARTLGELGDTAVVTRLINLIGDSASRVRTAAIEALAALGEGQLASAVRETLAGRDEGRAALSELVAGGDQRTLEPLARLVGDIVDEKAGTAASEALVVIGPLCIPALLPRLHDTFFFVRSGACVTLGRLGVLEAVEPLEECLRDADSRVRASARWALLTINTGQCCRHLVGLEELGPNFPNHTEPRRSSDPDVELVWDKVRTARHLDSTELDRWSEELAAHGVSVIGPLCAALSDQHYQVRRCAAHALGRMGHVDALSDLSQAFDQVAGSGIDLDWAAELAVILGSFRHPAAIPSLISALALSIPRWQCPLGAKAAGALGQIADEAALPVLCKALSAQWLNTRLAAVEALGKIGVAAVPVLCAALAYGVDDVRLGSAGQLGEIGDYRAIGPLRNALSDSEDRVRQNACWALGRLQATDAVHDICSLLTDRHHEVRRYAALALGEIGDARAVGPLSAALAHADGETVSYNRPLGPAVAEALGRIGDRSAIPALRKALNHQLPATRASVITALGLIGDLDGLCDALTLREGDIAADALTAAGDTVVCLVKSVIGRHEAASRRAVMVLGRIGSPTAVAALVDLLPMAALRGEVMRALLASGALAVAPVCAALRDNDVQVRACAASLLTRLCKDAATPELTLALSLLASRLRFFSRDPAWAKEIYREARDAIVDAVAQRR